MGGMVTKTVAACWGVYVCKCGAWMSVYAGVGVLVLSSRKRGAPALAFNVFY